MSIINKLEYKTYMGMLGIALSSFLFILVLSFASFYSFGARHFATIMLLIIAVVIFFLFPFRVFRNRKRLPIYSLDLKTDIITTSKCHPQIIKILSSQATGRLDILTMPQKKFDNLYPKKNMKIYCFDLKTYNKKTLFINHKWQMTDSLSNYRGFYARFTEIFSYQLLDNRKILSPLSKGMLLYLHRKGYILLNTSDWIEFVIREFLTLMAIGIIIILFMMIVLEIFIA